MSNFNYFFTPVGDALPKNNATKHQQTWFVFLGLTNSSLKNIQKE